MQGLQVQGELNATTMYALQYRVDYPSQLGLRARSGI